MTIFIHAIHGNRIPYKALHENFGYSAPKHGTHENTGNANKTVNNKTKKTPIKKNPVKKNSVKAESSNKQNPSNKVLDETTAKKTEPSSNMGKSVSSMVKKPASVSTQTDVSGMFPDVAYQSRIQQPSIQQKMTSTRHQTQKTSQKTPSVTAISTNIADQKPITSSSQNKSQGKPQPTPKKEPTEKVTPNLGNETKDQDENARHLEKTLEDHYLHPFLSHWQNMWQPYINHSSQKHLYPWHVLQQQMEQFYQERVQQWQNSLDQWSRMWGLKNHSEHRDMEHHNNDSENDEGHRNNQKGQKSQD